MQKDAEHGFLPLPDTTLSIAKERQQFCISLRLKMSLEDKREGKEISENEVDIAMVDRGEEMPSIPILHIDTLAWAVWWPWMPMVHAIYIRDVTWVGRQIRPKKLPKKDKVMRLALEHGLQLAITIASSGSSLECLWISYHMSSPILGFRRRSHKSICHILNMSVSCSQYRAEGMINST